MDHPKRQASNVIHLLTEGSPAEQKDALETYFLPDATFVHPLCRVPSFSHISLPLLGEINSRWAIWMIYRWYKILSPRIILNVECDEFNQESKILFVDIHQIFSIFFVPFYKSNVRLTTKLSLVQSTGDNKYYIKSQEDLYQLNEVVKFFWPGGATIIWFWQMFATFLCIVGALMLAPVTWMIQRQSKKVNGVSKHLWDDRRCILLSSMCLALFMIWRSIYLTRWGLLQFSDDTQPCPFSLTCCTFTFLIIILYSMSRRRGSSPRQVW